MSRFSSETPRAISPFLPLAFLPLVCLVAAMPPAWASPSPDAIAFFESKIRPVLAQHCYQCHSAEALRAGKLKANLLVDSRAGMMKGGESGAAVVPGKKEDSLLLAALKYDGFEMPPSGKLPDDVIADFEKWIDMGAPDPRDEPAATLEERSIDVEQGRGHWSYRRLSPVSPPEVKNAAWPRNDVDRFILAKQEAAGVVPADQAARETLARRVFFDLVGLPPTPGELQLFLADASPDAYEKLVDRLLASPRFGERWARHWLDAVRFAESGGYEFDGDRPGAHHYRDWVIRAFNADMPYDEFLRLQVAGDLLKPNDYDATSATGFFVAGPYPGQITAKTAEPIRYDQLDDMVTALGSGVLGMTIGCARCHDHKYDPIAQRDYYAMIACLKNTVHKGIDVDRDPEATRLARAEWEASRAPVLAASERFRETAFPGKLAAWLAGDATKLVAAAWTVLEPQAVSASKATLVREAGDVVAASGAVGNNDVYTLTFRTHRKDLRALRIEPLASPSAPGAGPGTGKEGAFGLTTLAVTAKPIVPAADRKPVTPKLTAVAATAEAKGSEWAKAIDGNNGTAWSVGKENSGKDHAAVLAFDQGIGFDGGTEISVVCTFGGGNHGFARVRVAAATDPATAPLVGGAMPQAGVELLAIASAAKAAGKDVARDPAFAAEAMRWFRRFDAETESKLAAVDAVAAKAPKPALVSVYATASGGGDVYFLKRGEVSRKDGKADPGFVMATVASDDAVAALLPVAPDRPAVHPRVGLANFLTSADRGAGPLAARVIVNRLWHHHFGRGLVATPNDLGTQGEKPTHPELLEWLAGRLVENQWSLKSIHRLVVTSAAYRQAGTANEANRPKDPDNLLVWHRKPLRLEGEVIRDALLAAAGKLDLKMFGPGSLDVANPRRSVYLTVKRSVPVSFLQVFDQPEPIQSVGARGIATVPTQALTMMNSPFVRSMAEGLAKRGIETVGPGEPAVEYCFVAALSRRPSPGELARFAGLLESRERDAGKDAAKRQAAVADVCQLMFCLNEFVYVD
jgi:hypothetical protein